MPLQKDIYVMLNIYRSYASSFLAQANIAPIFICNGFPDTLI